MKHNDLEVIGIKERGSYRWSSACVLVALEVGRLFWVDTLSVVANKGFKEKEVMCNFVNTNEVVKLLKKHVESINIFYI